MNWFFELLFLRWMGRVSPSVATLYKLVKRSSVKYFKLFFNTKIKQYQIGYFWVIKKNVEPTAMPWYFEVNQNERIDNDGEWGSVYDGSSSHSLMSNLFRK